jgi:hypothetical protein
MTALGGGRSLGCMNPIAFIETTAAVRGAVLGATPDQIVQPLGLHQRLIVATRRPRRRRA